MLKKLRQFDVFLIMSATICMIAVLSGCSRDTVQNTELKTTIEEEKQTSLSSEAIKENTVEENDDEVIMYYNMNEIIVEGNKIDSLNDVDYNLNKLIPVINYEQTGVKLYAYEVEFGSVGDTTYKLLLEHDGNYQVFGETSDIMFYYMFGYDSANDLYVRDFDEGVEYDFDNDGQLELAECVTTIYGPSILNKDIIVYDFNNDISEYEAYHIEIDNYKDLIDDAAKIFFDKYYCAYRIEKNGLYKFENNYVAGYGEYVDIDMSDDNEFEVRVEVLGAPVEEGIPGNSIGTMIFKVNYIGDGKFSIKPDRYEEWINIMEADLK